MFSRSLRWRLQAWHALILLLVVTGFGSVLFLQVRQARFDEIDAELLSGARVLEGTLRALPPPVLRDGFGALPPGKGAEPDDLPFPKGPSPAHLEEALRPPRSLLERHPEARPYFVVWLASNDILKAEPATLEVPVPDLPAPVQAEDTRVRQRAALREVIIMGPQRTQILVGRSIEQELAGLDRLAGQLGLLGAAVFAVGLVGGWWLSRRAVRPIEAMSSTAASISASNLSRRIEVTLVDDELSKLGGILNAMFERLEQAFDEQVRFTADASHELRTPLSVLLSHAELALARPRSEQEYRDTLETCLRAGRRMKLLVDDLLTLARADAGKLELKTQPVDLQRVVQDSIAFLAPLAQQRGVTVSHAGSAAPVQGDPDRLGQVVTNLLSNAILYNRPAGTVTLTTACTGPEVTLTVADTGVGIAAEECPRIFSRFFRVDRARSRESGGSGLGLAICKSIVEAHGGSIAVTSEPAVGSTFVVRLPRTSHNGIG